MNKDLGPVSAYAVAVANGFVGSVKEWLASLKGEKGKDGERGPAGADGKTPQLKIGTVTTGSTASASITGTAEEPQLNLVLPEGTGGSTGVGQSTEGGGEIFNDYKNNAATGGNSHAEGFCTTASGYESHAEGYRCEASGTAAHAEGNMCKAIGDYENYTCRPADPTGQAAGGCPGRGGYATGSAGEAEPDDAVCGRNGGDFYPGGGKQ